MDICWDSYRDRYASVEKEIELISPLSDYTDIVYETGSIFIEEVALNKHLNTELFHFFFGNKVKDRTVKAGKKYLLRGIEYYVGMIKDSNSNKTHIIFNNLKEYFAALEKSNLDDSYILYLGLLDNIKNYLLMVLYTTNQISRELGYMEENLLSINEYNKYLALINVIEFAFIRTYFTRKIYKPAGLENYASIINAVFMYISRNICNVEKNKKIKNKLIRKARETDNTLKMIELAHKVSEEFVRQDTVLIGIEYGGIANISSAYLRC